MNGQCAWFEDGLGCHNPAEVRGLCVNHFWRMNDRLKQQGLNWNPDTRPTKCTCAVPIPKPVTIFGFMTLTDVFQCDHCGRGIDT